MKTLKYFCVEIDAMFKRIVTILIAIVILSFVAVVGIGINAHSSKANQIKFLEMQKNLPANTITHSFFWLIGMDKDYYIFTYKAMEKGIKNEKVLENLIQVDYVTQGINRIEDLAKYKSFFEEISQTPYFKEEEKLNPPFRLSKYQEEFLDILAKLPEEKQILASEYAKDGVIAPSDVYSIKQIANLPLNKLEKLKKDGHLYPIIDQDEDGIPDTKDPQPNVYNPFYGMLIFPNRDGSSRYLAFSPEDRAQYAQAMNSLAQALIEFGIPKDHIYKLYNFTKGKKYILNLFDKIADDCKHYPGDPIIWFIITTHGDEVSLFTPDKFMGKAEETLRIHFLHYDELHKAIEKIQENSPHHNPIILLEIDACYSNKFINNTLKGFEGKSYVGTTILLSPSACWDIDKNGIVDYNELEIMYPVPFLGNKSVATNYFFIPISKEEYTKFKEKINDPCYRAGMEKFFPQYARPIEYPLHFLKAYLHKMNSEPWID